MFIFGVVGFFVVYFLHIYQHLCSHFIFFIAQNSGACISCSWCASACFWYNLLYHTSPARTDCLFHWCLLICLHIEGSFFLPFIWAFVSAQALIHMSNGHTRYLLPLHSSLSVCPSGACLGNAYLWHLAHPPLQVAGLQEGTNTQA